MTEQNLREMVSTLARMDPGQLTAATPIKSVLRDSLGLAKLDAALRSKFGTSDPTIYRVRTFGELCNVFSICSTPDAVAVPPSLISVVPSVDLSCTGNNIAIGVDVESIAAMRAVPDYWEDDFYKQIFTLREIAYALLQASPQASFAAMWCAKEALRKAIAALAQTDWQKIEVVHDALGKPSLLVSGQPVTGALSLSHTEEIAFAVFVTTGELQLAAPASTLPEPPIARSHSNNNRAFAMVAACALILSTAALVLSILRH